MRDIKFEQTLLLDGRRWSHRRDDRRLGSYAVESSGERAHGEPARLLHALERCRSRPGTRHERALTAAHESSMKAVRNCEKMFCSCRYSVWSAFRPELRCGARGRHHSARRVALPGAIRLSQSACQPPSARCVFQSVLVHPEVQKALSVV